MLQFPVGSPRSGSPQSPSSPGSVSSGMSPFPDHQSYINLQTNALQHHFENISMVSIVKLSDVLLQFCIDAVYIVFITQIRIV